MSPVNDDSAALASLADIELPAPPPAPDLLPWLIVFLLLLTVAAVVTTRRRRARKAAPLAPPPAVPAREALARLDTLAAEWTAGRIDDRETAFRLCTLLRIGLGLNRLQVSDPPPGIAPAAWSLFLGALHAVRYGPGDAALAAGRFDEARAWLAATRAEGAPHA